MIEHFMQYVEQHSGICQWESISRMTMSISNIEQMMIAEQAVNFAVRWRFGMSCVKCQRTIAVMTDHLAQDWYN